MLAALLLGACGVLTWTTTGAATAPAACAGDAAAPRLPRAPTRAGAPVPMSGHLIERQKNSNRETKESYYSAAAAMLLGRAYAPTQQPRLRLRGGARPPGGDAGVDDMGDEVRSIFSKARPNSSWQAATASQATDDTSEAESADAAAAAAAASTAFNPFDRSSNMWRILDQLEREEATALEAQAKKREQRRASTGGDLAWGSELQREFAHDLGLPPDALSASDAEESESHVSVMPDAGRNSAKPIFWRGGGADNGWVAREEGLRGRGKGKGRGGGGLIQSDSSDYFKEAQNGVFRSKDQELRRQEARKVLI
jgi:hypothetical protein